MLWFATIVAATLLTGCLAPPIFFPRTGVQGIVIDQDGNPVSNAVLKAYWTPVRLNFWFAPAYQDFVHTHKDGSWEFYRRKIMWLDIEVMATNGLECVSFETCGIRGLGPRNCPTNQVTLRVRRKPSEINR